MFFDETYAEEEVMLQLEGNEFGINEEAVSEGMLTQKTGLAYM